jgi:cytoskeletal protein CcmA (bactofilin family)
MVGEEGFIEGTVRARKLIVLGQVHGDVRGAESVEVGAGGRLLGTVETRSLVVREGGYLDGDCRIGPPRDKVRMLRSAPSS